MKTLRPSALLKVGWTGGYNLAWDREENRCDPRAPQARYWSIAGAIMRAGLPGIVGPEIMRRICRRQKCGATYQWEMDTKDKNVVLAELKAVEELCFREYQQGGLRGFDRPAASSPPPPGGAARSPSGPDESPAGATPTESDLCV